MVVSVSRLVASCKHGTISGKVEVFGVEDVVGFGGAVMLASFNRHLVRVCRFIWWKGSVYGSSVLQECFVVEYEPEMVEEVFERYIFNGVVVWVVGGCVEVGVSGRHGWGYGDLWLLAGVEVELSGSFMCRLCLRV